MANLMMQFFYSYGIVNPRNSLRNSHILFISLMLHLHFVFRCVCRVGSADYGSKIQVIVLAGSLVAK